MIDFDSEEVQRRRVRLFPTFRISSEREAELRATAALCAMLQAVSEFGRSFVRAAGGPAGRLSSFTEVSFKSDAPTEDVFRPDALVRVTRGKTNWVAMVEVKVGDSPLLPEQVNNYHKLARQHGADALITISNQAALANGLPQVSLDKRRLRGVPVHHLSWDRLLSEAKVLSRKKGIDDSDQEWMLDEWIKYVADPGSKIISNPDLGENWTKVLQAARESNLPTVTRDLQTVVKKWNSYLGKAALRLRAKLGVDVEKKSSRADRNDPAGRLKRLHSEALADGMLTGVLRVPDAIGDISLAVSLAGRTVQYVVEVKAPTEGRRATRINWLVKQLRREGVPSRLVVHTKWSQRKLSSQARVEAVLSDPNSLFRDHNGNPIPKEVEPRGFMLEWTQNLSKCRGRSSAPVLSGITEGLESFYVDVVQALVPYVPKAPRLVRDSAASSTPRAKPAVVSAEPIQDTPPREVVVSNNVVATVAPQLPDTQSGAIGDAGVENRTEPQPAP